MRGQVRAYGYASEGSSRVSEPQSGIQRALDGIIVLELGQVYNGPYCGLLLQRLGATVVKIEPPEGEPIRWRPGKDGTNQAFMLLNAGKQSLRLDLKKPAGREVMLRLVATADVVIENFAPGVLDRLGLSYKELAARNERIILASGKGYGSTGPNRNLLGMDITVQAMTAVVSTTGFPGDAPVKTGPAVVDFAAGVHLATAVLAALFQRTRTGQGQIVEVSMQDAIIPSLASNIAGYLDSDGDFPDRTGNRHGGLSVTPYNIYPAADGWIAILCIRDRHWTQLCSLMDRSDLANDPDLSTSGGRVKRMDEVDDAVREWTSHRPKEELFRLLGSAGVPASPVRTLAELIADPHVAQRGMLGTVGEGARRALTFGNPLRLSASEEVTLSPAPLLGEHSEQVLTEQLKLSSSEIAALAAQGVI